MYFVKYGTEYLHNPRIDEYILFDLSLNCEENSCGYCDFTIYPNHPLYDKLKEHDAYNQIKVYEDDELLFAGFIYEINKAFQLDCRVKCKGELAYLCESITRTYTTDTTWNLMDEDVSTMIVGYGRVVPDDIKGYFRWLISNHNAQVDEGRKFEIGTIEAHLFNVTDPLKISNDKYSTTWDELNEHLLGENGIGGYLRIRHEAEVRYIDYIYEYTDTNTQILDFGVNLTDFTQMDDGSELATFILPTGARMADTGYGIYNDPTSAAIVEQLLIQYPDLSDKYGPLYGYYRTYDTEVNPEKEYYVLGVSTEEDPNDASITIHCLRFFWCDGITEFENGKVYYEFDSNTAHDNQPLTIKGAKDKEYENGEFVKKGDIIYSKSAVEKYGWIGCNHSNTDIVTREALVIEGINTLKEKLNPKRTIEIKAIDMHLINPEIKPIRIGEYIRVRSKPHNLDSYFICRSIDLDLNTPDNSVYVLGMSLDTYTKQQLKMINVLNMTNSTIIQNATKPVTQIDAVKTGNQVTSVTMTYGDGTKKTYSYKFNGSGDVTQFGNIPINWSTEGS